jgi:uncharacterized membrane protein
VARQKLYFFIMEPTVVITLLSVTVPLMKVFSVINGCGARWSGVFFYVVLVYAVSGGIQVECHNSVDEGIFSDTRMWREVVWRFFST